MKRFLALLLTFALVFSLFSFTAFGAEDEEKLISNEDIKQLRSLFKVSSYEREKYAYYSPVKDENDTNKYPVIVFLHGLGHEFTYLSESFMPYWASEALQSKFNAGGAHIILPRIFHIATKADKIQSLIENYIAEHADNVDTNEIVIMGASLGGAKAFKLLVNNPGFYSAAVICCPANTPKEEKLAAAGDTPIWLISAKRDIITGRHLKSWERILATNSQTERCRWMFFDGTVYGVNGKRKFGHALSKIISYDGVMFDGNSFADMYGTVSTVNGIGETVEITSEHGIISWIEQK